MKSGTNYVKSRGFVFDLNSEDVSSSINHDNHPQHKNYYRVKSPQDTLSQCGSTNGLVGERDSMRVWKEMKQNGFLSSSHGGVPVPQIPKPRGRKRVTELVIKKNIEIAKKEQVDRFAKVAAPSGLLNGLNPGIINHVRNRKQVHSIIENLVRSAKRDNKHGGSGIDKETCGQMSHCNLYKEGCEDDILALKLSSSATMVSNTSSLSNEESGNISTVNSHSIRAANVASQWLELLHQDITGRLSALRHSRKRVQAVIQTELPFLVSKELVPNQENGYCDNGHAELLKARWGTLFDQMDDALSDEEKQLVNSLNQINEMLMHCERGLLQFHPDSGLQNFTNSYRLSKTETSQCKDLSVQAAAAAIYSTTSFLQSMENLPCF
nr:hypothetical protein [Tanacetum cinerariifolium]